MIDGLSYIADPMDPPGPYDRLKGHDYMRAITNDVCARHRVLPVEVRGPDRDRRTCEARDEAIGLIYGSNRFSLSQVGVFFGGRDHSTIHTAKNRHEARALAKQEAA